MSNLVRLGASAAAVLAAVTLGGCVSRSDYDGVVAQNNQLQSQVAAQQQQIARLQSAIKYTVDSDLLFSSGGWKMTDDGERVIANMATKLAPTQQNKLLVSGFTDNAPIGPGLLHQGITSNEILSQKRADTVMQFIVSQGMNPDLIEAKGFGEANPVASNDSPAGRTMNRPVELTLAQM